MSAAVGLNHLCLTVSDLELMEMSPVGMQAQAITQMHAAKE